MATPLTFVGHGQELAHTIAPRGVSNQVTERDSEDIRGAEETGFEEAPAADAEGPKRKYVLGTYTPR